jgi:Putative bacterial sensory transduction regulator
VSELRTFSGEMFEEYARGREYRHLVDGEGNYLIRFRAEGDVPALDCWLRRDPAGDVASVEFYVRERFGTDDAFAMSTCDAWNRTRRWPKAYTLARDGAVEIVLEGYLIATHGVSDDQLADFIDSYVRGAFCFWEELSVALRLQAV